MAPRLHLALAALLATTALQAQKPQPDHARGIWFWQTPQSPYGSVQIVGDNAKEDATIARLKAWGVTTLYGSYRGDGATDPAALRAWNRKLAKAGIASYLLLSETEYLFPQRFNTAASHIQQGFLDFNTAATLDERFAGLAFDIEPHIFKGSSLGPGWKAADSLQRRMYMDDYLHFFQHVRTMLNDAGAKDAKLEATLPTWYAKLEGNIAWASSLDRDHWFAAFARTCDRFSIMAFELDSAMRVVQNSAEETFLLNGKARIALRANLGNEWTTFAQFRQALHDVETATGQSSEIQDYVLLSAGDSSTP